MLAAVPRAAGVIGHRTPGTVVIYDTTYEGHGHALFGEHLRGERPDAERGLGETPAIGDSDEPDHSVAGEAARSCVSR